MQDNSLELMQEESTELMQLLTAYEPISSTGGASLKKEGEQLWTKLDWAPMRDDSGRIRRKP